MITGRRVLCLALAGALASLVAARASAQQTVKVGELNSYKSQPAFLEPYRKGIDLAVEEINAAGGVLGKRLEVISRDDGGNPGDAVRVAEELVAREGVGVIAGTFLSNVGLAVTEFAGKNKVFFLAAEPLTDKITWQNGNKYTYRLRSSTYMQVAMLMPDIVAARKKRWALVYPNFEYGQSAVAALKSMLTAKQPGVEFVTELLGSRDGVPRITGHHPADRRLILERIEIFRLARQQARDETVLEHAAGISLAHEFR